MNISPVTRSNLKINSSSMDIEELFRQFKAGQKDVDEVFEALLLIAPTADKNAFKLTLRASLQNLSIEKRDALKAHRQFLGLEKEYQDIIENKESEPQQFPEVVVYEAKQDDIDRLKADVDALGVRIIGNVGRAYNLEKQHDATGRRQRDIIISIANMEKGLNQGRAQAEVAAKEAADANERQRLVNRDLNTQGQRVEAIEKSQAEEGKRRCRRRATCVTCIFMTVLCGASYLYYKVKPLS
jgi:hypothetical protein